MTYVLGILAMAAGAAMTIKNEWLVQNIGRSAWAEDKLGGMGGTRTFYKLLGVGVFILSLLIMTGTLGEIVLAIFLPLFGGLTPGA